ncbi:reverse transcriptase domain-containing protein [Tanacetum coccineum]
MLYNRSTPVQQKKRRMAPYRIVTASKEVEELKKAGILRETRYQMWVVNTVIVKKTNGAWRMCVDFTNINKACPKDCYLLPKIDWKVDSLSDFKLKCFLDAYKGYHQIQMAKEDEHKTAFHASHGVYCYRKMPFGLKNAGATYQRLSRKKDFTWTREAYKVIEEMKRYIEKFPIIVTPKARENLIVYLAASKECISVVLMEERGKDQRPIYFVSRVLQGAKLNYTIMEKLVLALTHVARSLKRYFQAHNIIVLTNKPIRLLLSKPEKSGRVARWAIELGEHGIEFKPRNAVKAQILTNFLAETKKEDKETDFQEQ